MPHKRNPISAETISGLSRVLRGNLQAGMQDVALWHERDISHSSVERIILPDSSLMAYYVHAPACSVCSPGCRCSRTGCGPTSTPASDWCSASPCCWRWCRAGSDRDEAYRIVQDNAARAWSEQAVVPRTARRRRRVSPSQPELLDEAFDLQRSLRHSRRGVRRTRRAVVVDAAGRRSQSERVIPARFSTAASTPISRHVA